METLLLVLAAWPQETGCGVHCHYWLCVGAGYGPDLQGLRHATEPTLSDPLHRYEEDLQDAGNFIVNPSFPKNTLSYEIMEVARVPS